MQFPITECPYCGNDEVKIKCKISGECEYNLCLDGTNNAYNGEMYDHTMLKPMGKYAYCNNCGKRLFEHKQFTL